MGMSEMITQQPAIKMTTPILENRTTPDKVETSIGTLEFFEVCRTATPRTRWWIRPARPGGRSLHQHRPPGPPMYSLRQGHRDLGLTECNRS